MPRSLCLAVLLVALAAAGVLAFAAAAGQAAVGPPLAARPAAAAAASSSSDGGGGSAIDAGQNIGSILKSWGGALLLGVAGLRGLAALVRRDVAEGVTLLVIVVIVGGFIYAPDQVKGLIQSLWQPVSGG